LFDFAIAGSTAPAAAKWFFEVGVHDASRDVVCDHERQERLRQEARLEDAAAVLVRDPALLAVADCLDHGHAHVPGRILDRVDHGLDALPYDYCLDFDHPPSFTLRQTACFRAQKNAPGARNPRS